MSVDFVAIDFETATHEYDSACEIGVSIVEDGIVAESFSRLIRPPTRNFNPHNMRLHGISWDLVKDQPDFRQVWDDLMPKLGAAAYFVAHNAGFDQKVLSACCDYCGAEVPGKCAGSP